MFRSTVKAQLMNERSAKLSIPKIIGWILSALLTAFMLFSATGKFVDFPGKAEMFAQMGWTVSTLFNIGILEVAIALLFLVPRASFVAAILITAYLGGAVATHVRVNEAFYFPIVLGVIYWVALGLRDRRIFDLTLSRSSSSPVLPE